MLTKRYNNPTIPFMAAGLTDHVWPMEDLLTFKPVNYCRLNGPRPEFELGRKFSSSEDIIHHFKGFLLNAYASDTKVLIIIDKAQRLHSELREEIRHLSAIKMAGRRFLKIFIVSQTEFNDILMGEENADRSECHHKL